MFLTLLTFQALQICMTKLCQSRKVLGKGCYYKFKNATKDQIFESKVNDSGPEILIPIYLLIHLIHVTIKNNART